MGDIKRVSVIWFVIFLLFSLAACSDWGEWAGSDDLIEGFDFDSSTEERASADTQAEQNDGTSGQSYEAGDYDGTESAELDYKVICSGGLLSGNTSYKQDGLTVELGKDTAFSDFVEAGRFDDIADACPDAIAYTLDSIAIKEGYIVTIYAEPSLGGEVLLNETGPVVVYNVKWKEHETLSFLSEIIEQSWNGYDYYNSRSWEESFPPSTRKWSETDMHGWSGGSILVELEQQNKKNLPKK